MEFKYKKNIISGGRTVFSGEYPKPMVCPHCGIHTDSAITKADIFNYTEDEQAYVVSFRCTDCEKTFLCVYIGTSGGIRPEAIIPVSEENPVSDNIKKLSPQGAKLHSQSERAALRSDYELAMAGYRSALESIIKDYAIKIRNESQDDVASKTLGKAIEAYLEEDILKSADVVRILGNGATHYVNAYEDIDFSTFKLYYDWVLQYIDHRYQIAHPPVTR